MGINLGTAFSCLSAWDDRQRRVTVLQNEQGNRTTPTTPSVVAFSGTERGEAVACQGLHSVANTAFDVKRLIGRKFSDAQVKTDCQRIPFRVVRGANDRPQVRATTWSPAERSSTGPAKRLKAMLRLRLGLFNSGRQHLSFSPGELSAKVLGNLKGRAEVEVLLRARVEEAVIAVPACMGIRSGQAEKAQAKVLEKEEKRRKKAAEARDQLEVAVLTLRWTLRSYYACGGDAMAPKIKLATAAAEELLKRTRHEPAERVEYKKHLEDLKMAFLPKDRDEAALVEGFFLGMSLGGSDTSESEESDASDDD